MARTCMGLHQPGCGPSWPFSAAWPVVSLWAYSLAPYLLDKNHLSQSEPAVPRPPSSQTRILLSHLILDLKTNLMAQPGLNQMKLFAVYPGTMPGCSRASGSGKARVSSSTSKHQSEDSSATLSSANKSIIRTKREIRRRKISVETIKDVRANHGMSNSSETESNKL